MPAIQVKCYLLKKNAESVDEAIEKKRFTFAFQQESSGLYDSLIDAIMNHFNSNFKSKSDFKTYWLDEEGELVRFSTNSELLNVIAAFKESILRIYLKEEAIDTSNIFSEIFSFLKNPQLMSTVGNILESTFGNINEMPQSNSCSAEQFKLRNHEIEERVKTALVHLKQMGFSADIEVLSALLRENQGNINPVLDTMLLVC